MATSSDKYKTQNDLLKYLYFHGSQSCSELSRRTKRSIPIVSKLLNELMEEGFIITNGYAASTGGRRPLNYSLEPGKGYIVAVSMDQLFTNISIVDLGNQVVTDREIIELNLYNTENSLDFLAEAICIHIEKSGVPRGKIIGVGIGMPGFINTEEGINYTFFNQHEKLNHRDFLKKKIGLPVYIDNDSRLTALAEWMFGSAMDHQNALIINVGWGTGLGIIVNGKLFRGDAGYAGEFSHIPLSDNGILCECGKRGCLETETSLLLMSQKAVKDIQDGKASGLKLKEVQYMSEVLIESAGRGDQYCIELLSHVGFMLGKGISILIHILNPELIVVSGRGAKAERILRAPLQQALNQFCIPRMAAHTLIAFSKMAEDSGLLGAAGLVMEHARLYKKAKIKKTENEAV